MTSRPTETAPNELLEELNREFATSGIDSTQSDGVRQWKIVLRSGAEISFNAAWNMSTGNGSAQMVKDHISFLSSGVRPSHPRPYRFPETNRNPRAVAILSVDIADVQAIVQTFGT